MEYLPVGNSLLSVSRIGFGCAAIGGYDYGPVDDAQSIRAIHHALECGITLFDVADVYGFGHAETVLGKALKTASAKAVIATKVGVRWDEATRRTQRDLSGAYLTQAVEASLRRLQVERLDICQLHWPAAQVAPEEALEPLQRLRAEGKIGVLGVCNVSLQWLESARVAHEIETVQLPCSLLEPGVLPTLTVARRKHGIATFVYNALAHGLLTGKFDKSARFPPTDLRNRIAMFRGAWLEAGLRMAEELRQMALDLNKTPAQVAIRWLLEQEGISCVLTGIKTPEQAEVNARSVDWRLPEHACEQLSRLAELLRSSMILEAGSAER